MLFAKLYAQETDSIHAILISGTHDSVFVEASLDFARQTLYSNTDTSLYFAKTVLDLDDFQLNKTQLLESYKSISRAYVLLGEYDSALRYITLCIDIEEELSAENNNDKAHLISLSGTYGIMAIIYYYKADYEKAIEYNLTALKLSEKAGYYRGISVCQSNIGNINYDLQKYDIALDNYLKSLEAAKHTGDLYDLSGAYSNLGFYYVNQKNYENARVYFLKAISINKQLELETELAIDYMNMAKILNETANYDSALYYAHLGLKISKRLDKHEGVLSNLIQLGEIFSKNSTPDSAILCFSEVARLAKNSGMDFYQIRAFNNLSDLYAKSGNYKKAFHFNKVAGQLKDSIFDAEKDKNISELEIKYQNEKKEEQINFLKQKTKMQAEKARQNKVLLGLISLILVMLVVIVMGYYRSAKVKQLAEKRRLQQEAERQLLDTVIETEYKERRRFAEDLHDGLGVLLSALRLYLNEINNAPDAEKRMSIIASSNNMLDEAIENARNISNNIMPASIKSDGLEYALRAFCDKINASGKISIKVNSTNFSQRLSNTDEISLYRVLTEMINNTLKHAEATEINISLLKKADKLFVTYRDNGKGFDFEEVISSSNKGMGLDNTISRINSIGGKCTIKSKPGEGFFAGIEVDALRK